MEGTRAQISSTCLTLVWLVLGRSCSCYDSCCEFMCVAVMLCSEDTDVLESSIIPGYYGLFVLFSAVISGSVEESHSIYAPYRAEHPLVLVRLHLGQNLGDWFSLMIWPLVSLLHSRTGSTLENDEATQTGFHVPHKRKVKFSYREVEVPTSLTFISKLLSQNVGLYVLIKSVSL